MKRRRHLGFAAAMCLCLAGCSSVLPQASLPTRRLEEDLTWFLPAGADLVLDVDVAQLRAWPSARRLFKCLPDAAPGGSLQLGWDALGELDELALAVSGAGTEGATTTWVARGVLDEERVQSALGAGRSQTLYRGVMVSEAAARAVARPATSLWAFGSPVDVRRVIDVVRGVSESLAVAGEDRELEHAYGRAPTAKVGHPAARAALRMTGPMRERLHAERLPGGTLSWIAASLAVGDGLDLGAVGGAPGPIEARALVASAKVDLSGLRDKMWMRALGFERFVDPLILVSKDSEIHIAYRLPQLRLNQLLARIESFQAMARPKVRAP